MEGKTGQRFAYRDHFLPSELLLPLLPPLRTFEASLVARFIPSVDKIATLITLNKSWLTFIFQNYAWTQFPCES